MNLLIIILNLGLVINPLKSISDWMGMAIYFAINALLAYLIGRKRQIGFKWSWFFFSFLSIMGGLIITYLSPKYYNQKANKSYLKIISGWVLSIIFGLIDFLTLASHRYDIDYQSTIMISTGLFGLGLYLIQIGKGRIPNTSLLINKTSTNDSYKTGIDSIEPNMSKKNDH